MDTPGSAVRAGLFALLLGALTACNGSSQSLDSPPPPDAIESLDDLPGGIGATNETPDSPPNPE